MKRSLQITTTIVACFLAARVVLVWVLGVKEAYWYCLWIPLLIFILAFLEIAWAKASFQRLEPTVTSLIAGRKSDSVRKWYKLAVKRMFSIERSVLTAFAFLPLVVFGVWSVRWGAWLSNGILRWYDTVCLALMFTATASSQWPFATISSFVIQLPKKELTINFYAHRRDTIMVIGSFMLGVALGGMALTMLAMLMLYVSPAKVDGAIQTLLLAVLVWAVVWFFVTQWNIHECMVKEKRQRLQLVSQKMMQSLDACLWQPTRQNVGQYHAIREVYERVAVLPEWPFSFQNVVTLISSMVLPIVLAMFGK